MQETVVIGGEIQLLELLLGDCSLSDVVDGEVGEFLPLIPNPYTGELTITPSEETQTLQTDGKSMPGNVIVEPIPQNYGRIVWNGSTITVY